LAVSSEASTAAVDGQTVEARDMYAALLQGELSGTDALAASQQMLQILMDSMTNAVFWKDVDSGYLGCNKVFARFAGVEPELLIGMSDRDMPWADSEEFSADWFIDWDRAVIDSGEPRFGILEQLRRADGENRWLETNKVPLRDLDGEVIGVLGTFEDVTDRHRAQEDLQLTLDELDERVQTRTTELMRTNESLRREVEDRVRLQAEEHQQRAYAEALRDTAAAMSVTPDLDEVTEQVLVGVERLVSNDLAAIVLLDDDDALEMSRCHAGFGYEPDAAQERGQGLETLSILEHLQTDQRSAILDGPERSIGPARSVLGTRIRVGGQLVGYLIVESATAGFFTERHADRLVAVADQAGAAISNSRLASRVSELATAEERQRIARELHDAINQTLWTASLTAESLLRDMDDESEFHHRVNRLRQLTRGALAEMRALLLEMRPSELAEISLDELLEYLLAALDCRRQLEVTSKLDSVTLGPDAHHAFYRIAQQALGNVAQHSGATSLDVRLTEGPPAELCISDDGSGFDPESVAAGHFGLAIMRERADSVGARLSVETQPGKGTTIRLTLDP
jgi:PAS domain S-box-containing protein